VGATSLTIYEHYGGFSTVRRIVSDFYDRVLDSPLIGGRFEDVDVRRLIEHQTRFISFVMGGPASFSDEHLQHVHARLHIKGPEFEEMVALLRETLEDHDLADQDVEAVERQIRRRQALIVNES
jgi:hemoglobin